MKRKFLNKSTLAIAAISTLILAGCSSVKLYPDQKSKNTQALNSSNFSQVEVQLINNETHETEITTFTLIDDKLPEKNISTTLGNKKVDLKIAIEDCALCESSKLMARASVKSESIIKVTEVLQSNVLPNELAALEPMSDSVKLAISDSLDPGEEILVDLSKPKTPVTVEVITDTPPTSKIEPNVKNNPTEVKTVKESVANFTPPERVKPFIYNSDKVNDNDIFQPHITQYAKKSINFNGGEYQDLISKEALKTTSTLVNYETPITVKFKLIK